MPSLNTRERAVTLMRYIYNHPDSKHTYESLTRETGIPSASIRKTVYKDYPSCFTRDWATKGIVLPDPVIYPDYQVFDLHDPDTELTLSELEKPNQLTIEDERLAWKIREQELIDIIKSLTDNPQKASRSQATPKDGFIVHYPNQKFYDRGNATLRESAPELMNKLIALLEDVNSDKKYYEVWNAAVAALIFLKAARTKDMELSIKEWVK